MATVCVIGAGTAGLCAAKYSIENGFNVVIFEQTNEIGGTWVYTDQIGKDEYGLEVHSAMYKSLRTNLPKEIMGFHDYPIPNTSNISYITADEVFKFLESYCNHFNLKKYIKFRHYAINVEPYESSKWKVSVKNLLQNENLTFIFDFVIICNGHYCTPRYPIIPGIETFHGQKLHSHQFRCSDVFKDNDVLVIGSGPSGRDIANDLSQYARKVTISHHAREKFLLSNNIIHKPDIKAINEDIIEFIDESKDKFNVIIYCTGYYYKFPFLNSNCGITVNDNFVQPLYKQCININYPTMSFIGLPFRSLIAQLIDLQVRFIMEFYTGRKILPLKNEMLKITEIDMEKRWKKGWKKCYAHMLGFDFRHEYYSDLAKIADIECIKPVMEKLINENDKKLKKNFLNFRNFNYKIIDDHNFVEI